MKKTFLLLPIIIGGCASPTKLTSGGESVFVTPPTASYLSNCEMLGQVRVNNVEVNNIKPALVYEHLKNTLRNKTSEKYPTSDTVIFNDRDTTEKTSSGKVNLLGVAMKCDK